MNVKQHSFSFICAIVIAAMLAPTAILSAAERNPVLPRSAPRPPAPATSADKMRLYETPYYIIHSDLDPKEIREVALRMTDMAEEYHARTRGFSGAITRKLPFYLYANARDYYAAGGIPGSAGVFTGDRLMAVAGRHVSHSTWLIIQHEGFHQFASAVIRGRLPAWANEGLADYFGEALWTGDGFVTGIIPPARLARLQAEIKSGKLKSIKEMMLLRYQDWNAELSGNNYDQAWSMVHFLAHADGGRYQQPFTRFMRLIGGGQSWEQAWRNSFGDAVGFEKQWKAWWLGLKGSPTADLYCQAAAQTLTSFLARAYTQQQTFDSFADFLKTANAGQLKCAAEDWLPSSLLSSAVHLAQKTGQWKIETASGRYPALVVTLEDQTFLKGTFTLSHGGKRIKAISIDRDDSGKQVAQARALARNREFEPARQLLLDVIRTQPRSLHIKDARALLAEIRKGQISAASEPAGE